MTVAVLIVILVLVVALGYWAARATSSEEAARPEDAASDAFGETMPPD